MRRLQVDSLKAGLVRDDLDPPRWCGKCSDCRVLNRMSSGTIRRRVHHEDVGGRKYERMDTAGSEGLDEPLLGQEIYADSRPSYVSVPFL